MILLPDDEVSEDNRLIGEHALTRHIQFILSLVGTGCSCSSDRRLQIIPGRSMSYTKTWWVTESQTRPLMDRMWLWLPQRLH